MEFTSAVTKEIDSVWAEGSAAGGLDSGTVVVDSTYYIFVINNPTTGVTDGLISLSRTAPTLPSGYTKKRLVGYITTESGGLIDDWNVVWTSFGAATAPNVWLMTNLNSSNSVENIYFVFGNDPATTGARIQITNAGALNADDDITAFASS